MYVCMYVCCSIFLPGAESVHGSVVEVYVSAIRGLHMQKFPPALSASVGGESVGEHLLVEGEGGVVVHQEVESARGLPQEGVCVAPRDGRVSARIGYIQGEGSVGGILATEVPSVLVDRGLRLGSVSLGMMEADSMW